MENEKEFRHTTFPDPIRTNFSSIDEFKMQTTGGSGGNSDKNKGPGPASQETKADRSSRVRRQRIIRRQENAEKWGTKPVPPKTTTPKPQ